MGIFTALLIALSNLKLLIKRSVFIAWIIVQPFGIHSAEGPMLAKIIAVDPALEGVTVQLKSADTPLFVQVKDDSLLNRLQPEQIIRLWPNTDKQSYKIQLGPNRLGSFRTDATGVRARLFQSNRGIGRGRGR